MAEKNALEQIRLIATTARAGYVKRGKTSGEWRRDLAGECVGASLAVSAALKAAGFEARVYCGYFELDEPGTDDCRCGRLEGHNRACYFVPHAWVEVAGVIVDVSANQFDGRVYTSRPIGEVELAALDGSFYTRRLPAGVPGFSSARLRAFAGGTWRAGYL